MASLRVARTRCFAGGERQLWVEPAGSVGYTERPLTAHLAHCPEPRRRSLDPTDTGRSALVAGTGLHAPHLPFAIPAGIGSIGWKAVPRYCRSDGKLTSIPHLSARIPELGG